MIQTMPRRPAPPDANRDRPGDVFARLDPDVARKLRELAEADKRSLSNYLAVVLSDHVATEYPKLKSKNAR